MDDCIKHKQRSWRCLLNYQFFTSLSLSTLSLPNLLPLLTSRAMEPQSTANPVTNIARRMESMLTGQGRDEREHLINTLMPMYETIRNSNVSYYPADEFPFIKVKCHPLQLNQQPASAPDMFFMPMAKEELDQQEVDLTDAETRRRVESRSATWDEQRFPEFLRNHPKGLIHQYVDAAAICALLHSDYLAVKRKGPGKEPSANLARLTDWRPR